MIYRILSCIWIIGELFVNNSVICQAEIIISPKEMTVSNVSEVKKIENGTTITMSRITQPSEMLHLQRDSPMDVIPKNLSTNINTREFVPSPPVEEYEYNKKYVKPAIPEAKSFNSDDLNTWEKKHDVTNWKEYGSSWNNKVKFPSNAEDSPSLTDNLRNHKNEYSSNYYTQKKPFDSREYQTPGHLPDRPVNIPKAIPTDSYGPPIENNLKPPYHNVYSGNFVEKPKYYEEEIIYPPHYGYSYEVSIPHGNQGYGEHHTGGNVAHPKTPWKKIIKFLATIIPIGLLISALTPNVITIQNNTDPT